MKGKDMFTEDEASKIISLKIRDKIRSLGFYSTDFGMDPGYGYTAEDFKEWQKLYK